MPRIYQFNVCMSLSVVTSYSQKQPDYILMSFLNILLTNYIHMAILELSFGDGDNSIQ